jgi:hypothetical protein
MPQASNNSKFRKATLLVALPALALLLGIAALSFTLKSAARRAVGLMPEIVCTADHTLMTIDEIVVRAPRPGHIVGVVARLSGINK